MLPERARALLRQPHYPGAARQDIGGLFVDQRHVLHPRPRPRLRYLAAARKRRLVVGRRAPVFQEHREISARSQRVAWRRRRTVRAGQSPALGNRRSLEARRDRIRHSGDRRPQRRRQRRHHLFSGNDSQRAALVGRAGVPAPGDGPVQPAGSDQRPRQGAAARRQARGRRRVLAGRRTEVCAGQGRSDPGRRRDRVAAAPATLRRRPCCAARATRHSRCGTSSPASARTCRTTGRFARPTRSRTRSP